MPTPRRRSLVRPDCPVMSCRSDPVAVVSPVAYIGGKRGFDRHPHYLPKNCSGTRIGAGSDVRHEPCTCCIRYAPTRFAPVSQAYGGERYWRGRDIMIGSFIVIILVFLVDGSGND